MKVFSTQYLIIGAGLAGSVLAFFLLLSFSHFRYNFTLPQQPFDSTGFYPPIENGGSGLFTSTPATAMV